MTIERAKWAMIAFLFFIDVVVFYVGYQVGAATKGNELADRDRAIQECTEDLLGEDKCGKLYNYTVSLEDENARLNKKIKGECKRK